MDPDLVRIADELVSIVRASPQDLTLSGYWEEHEQLVADLRDHAARFRDGDASRLAEFRFLFLPTGALQDLSLVNGWVGRYMALAERFDAVDKSGDPPES